MGEAREDARGDQFDEMAVLTAYGLAGAKLDLINNSENRTFRVVSKTGNKSILRAYRPGHRTLAEIHSELDWMQALTMQAGIPTPGVIHTRSGERVHRGGNGRHYAMFEFVPGVSPPESDLVPWFARLGRVCAHIHVHGAQWKPSRFVRPHYDMDTLVGDRAVWGRWQAAQGLDVPAITALRSAVSHITSRLEQLSILDGASGIIHGDLRLANLLVAGDQIHIIDFDDCGTGWFLYDLATALSLIEDLPEAPAAVRAWLDAYCGIRPVSSAQRQFIPDLIMLRRIQVLSWFASHPDAELTREVSTQAIDGTISAAIEYAAGNSRFAEKY